MGNEGLGETSSLAAQLFQRSYTVCSDWNLTGRAGQRYFEI